MRATLHRALSQVRAPYAEARACPAGCQSGGFPFLKKDLILINALHVPTVIRICDLFSPERRYEAAELLRDLAEPLGGFPQSYFRLSMPLLDAVSG